MFHHLLLLLQVGLFHYIQGLIEHHSEMLRMDKTKVALWSRRLQLALRAYQELLMTLAAMDKCSSSEPVQKSARVIKANVFYVLEYREMCLVLLQNYCETQHSVSYLKDLVETTHIFLKLLEQFCKTNRHVVVQKTVRRNAANKSASSRIKPKSKTKSSTFKKKTTSEPATAPLSTAASFDEISGQVSAALQQAENGLQPIDVLPFDAASDVPIDDQKYVIDSY